MTDIVTDDLAHDDARLRCDRVKEMVSVVTEDLVTLYERRGWVALGYQSWAELCRVEFDGVQIAPGHRRAVANELREAGLSVRAIAAATKTTKSTTARDLQVSHSGTPDVPDLFAEFAARHPIPPRHDDDLPATRTTISGTDGKTYRKAAAATPRAKRKPLSDEIRKAAYDLEKLARRFRRIEQDSRFPQFAELLVTNGFFTSALDDLNRIRDHARDGDV
jgi:hypothetical protein